MYLHGLMAVIKEGRNLALSCLTQALQLFEPHVVDSAEVESIQTPSSLPACEQDEEISDASDIDDSI